MESPKNKGGQVDNNLTSFSLEAMTTTTISSSPSFTSKDDSSLVPAKGEAKRQWKTNGKTVSSTGAEEKLPDSAEECIFGIIDEQQHCSINSPADGRPGAVRVVGIDSSHLTLFNEEDYGEGQEKEEEEGLDNAAMIQGSVVAEVVDDDQLYDEFRRRHESETAVTLHDVVEAEKVVTLDEGKRKARRRWIALGVVIVIATIAAVITGTLVYLSKKSNPLSPLNAATQAVPTTFPTLSRRPTEAPSVSRLDAKASLFDPNTSQYRSLEWLAKRDPFMLGVTDLAETIIN